MQSSFMKQKQKTRSLLLPGKQKGEMVDNRDSKSLIVK